jgi:hypothetical protein
LSTLFAEFGRKGLADELAQSRHNGILQSIEDAKPFFPMSKDPGFSQMSQVLRDVLVGLAGSFDEPRHVLLALLHEALNDFEPGRIAERCEPTRHHLDERLRNLTQHGNPASFVVITNPPPPAPVRAVDFTRSRFPDSRIAASPSIGAISCVGTLFALSVEYRRKESLAAEF